METGFLNKVLLDERRWRISESVHLGLGSIYLRFFDKNMAVEEFRYGEEKGIYARYEKVARYSYKYYLTESVVKEYRENVLPNLPAQWWIKQQPWMHFCGGLS